MYIHQYLWNFYGNHVLTLEVGPDSRVQQQGDDQTIQTQHFSENQNQDHSHKQSWLLGSATDAGVSHNTNGKTSGQSGQSDGQTGTQLNEARVQGLLLLQGVRQQHRHHQTVNGDNTGHNDGDDVLDQQVWSQHTGGTDAHTTLGSTV